MSAILDIAALQLRLAKSYVDGVLLLTRLPHLLKHPMELDEKLAGLAPGATIDIQVPKSIVRDYDAMMAATKARCLAIGPSLWLRDFENRLLPAMLLLRAVAAACALYYGPAGMALVASILALQLVIAPFSLIPAVTTLVVLIQPMLVGHYLVYPLLDWAAHALLPAAALDAVTLVIGPQFLAAYLVVDQLLCVLCLFWNPDGTPTKVPMAQLARSIAVGFVDGKTYQIIIFSLLAGLRVNVAVLALDYALGLTDRVCELARRQSNFGWSFLFYHQHRLAHMPCVYQHAHKFHHWLQGSTAFDAHIYGHGSPEELAMIAVEVGVSALCGVPPVTLNFLTMWHAWTDKVSHTAKTDNALACNMHVMHHTYHTKNYAMFDVSLDLLFGTCADNRSFPGPHGFTITRCDTTPQDATIRLQYAR